jgi:hypothetical protein
MKTKHLAAALFVTLLASPVRAQSVHAELDLTAGGSTEEVVAGATQLRLFGDVAGGVQYFSEVAWAGRDLEEGYVSDAFGAAYPYGNRVQAIEAYVEKMFRPKGGLLAVRAGRFRPPFGIYNRSDFAYSGFLRAPLIRYDGYYALSNNYLEHGADVVVGAPHLYGEVGVGSPEDVGTAKRRGGTDVVLRAQGYAGPFIVGVSHIRTQPYLPPAFARGQSVFTGVDVRWMAKGVALRGEWIDGQACDDTRTYGGYLDLIVHQPFMGPATLVARTERSDYEARAPFASGSVRHTIGGRVRILRQLSAQIDLFHQTGNLARGSATALDAALTYSIRLH